MESHSENQQLVSAEIRESDKAAPPGGQQEIQSEPGYRFWPTDEEIIVHYLRRKMADPDFKSRAIPDKDISSLDPREPYDGRKMSQEHVFFFTKKTIMTKRKGNKFSRTRFGKGGCWNYLGTETGIYTDSEGSKLLIGVKENYRFCLDPGKMRTNWNMIEYGLPQNKPQDWVVRRVFYKKGDLKVDPPEKWPGASGSSSTAPTENLQHYAGPVVSTYDSSQLNFINTASGSSSMDMYTGPAMLQQDVASMGTVYGSLAHSGDQRGYNLNQPQINMPTQQQQEPVNTHSDEQWVLNYNQQPVNWPTTLQGPQGPAHPASTMASTTPYIYSMVNQQLPDPNLQSDVGSIIGTGTLGWTSNPNFTQPFYNPNQRPFHMPILQGQYQPVYPANNYMENQQLHAITTPPILPPDVTTRPVGGNFNPNLTQPDVGSNSSHNRRPRSGNHDQSSVPPQGSDSQPSKYRKT